MVHVQLEVDMITRPAAADNASEIVALQYLHPERSVGSTTTDCVIGNVPCLNEAEAANLYSTVMHTLGRADHAGYTTLCQLPFEQRVTASSDEDGKGEFVMHDKPCLIDGLPQLRHSDRMYEAGLSHLPARVSIGPTDKVGLSVPSRLSPWVRAQRQSEVLRARPRNCQVTKALSTIPVAMSRLIHTLNIPLHTDAVDG